MPQLVPQAAQIPAPSPNAELAARCHEIQVCLGTIEVPEFDNILEVGMAVRLALHLRGLPNLRFQVVGLVSVHYLGVPGLAVQRIIELLAEVDFVRITTEGRTIKTVLPGGDRPARRQALRQVAAGALFPGRRN